MFIKSLLVIIFLSTSFAHMEVSYPYPRYSKFSPYYKSIGMVDYSNLAPLGSMDRFDKPYPCKGYPKGPVQASFKAGDTIKLTMTGGAIHDGGHCQFAISYDQQKWVVIKDVFTRCMLDTLNFDIPIPVGARPAKNATLSFNWINNVGNREWYMNCIDIEITGGNPSGTITGPELLVANLPGYVVFPQFNQGGDHVERFAQRPQITIP
ncbi:hypothetical protein K502DRAFT_347123 [Neoconidiobolus thromboides FSU 785]|nr:hypothetical protein K502DRAFT_347123 [Neoconidiobolus thromboides FSU 785]